MKVAFYLNSFPSISETFIWNQIKALRQLGVTTDVYSNQEVKGTNPLASSIKSELNGHLYFEPDWNVSTLQRIIVIVRLSATLLFSAPKSFFRLFFRNDRFFDYELLRAASICSKSPEYDLVHAHFGPNGVKVLQLQAIGLLKAPLICSFHGYDVDHEYFTSKPGFYKNLFKQAVYITGNSQYTMRNIQRLGCRPEKLKYVPETLFTSLFQAKGNRTIGNEIVKLVSVGRLIGFKGFIFALQAVKKLIDQDVRKIQYKLIGDGPSRPELEQYIKDHNLGEYVELLGSRDQQFIINELSGSDIFIMTGVATADGRQENQGLVIQEAASMELPVVVSDIGGVKEGIIPNVTGFAASPGNVQEIADFLDKLINDPTLRVKMGTRGREFVIEKFDAINSGRNVIDLYNSIIAVKS